MLEASAPRLHPPGMTEAPHRTRIVENVDLTIFPDIVRAYRPAVLKGFVRDWPAVRAGASSPAAARDYLAAAASDAPVEYFIGPAAMGGRFFYDESMRGFNFERRKAPLRALLDRLVAAVDERDPPAIYAGSVLIPGLLSGFTEANRMPLLPSQVPPRIWIGNATIVSTHYDVADNIACVVSGHRRFTFFPPDQVANLYVGPLEHTMAGRPASLVDVTQPDFERYPRFREALASAERAELEPGDAVYIPALWWHHVEAQSPFNLLVNYWWSESDPSVGSAFEAMIHGLLTIRDLPEPQREAWRTIFDHYVFRRSGDPAAHLPPAARGILGPSSPQRTQKIRDFLIRSLARS